MPANKRLLILPGDGIGPEVMGEVRRVIDWMAKRRAATFDVTEGLVGGAAYDIHGMPITDETMAQAKEVDAVLLGAVGGPKWDDLPFADKPERGLLRLRKDMDLFANLRPAVVFDALADASTLKEEVIKGLDIGRTSAADPRASTRRGRFSASASAASSPPASPTSSIPTA